MKTTRFGVSMDDELLEKLDSIVQSRSYPNRSEAIRDLVRGALVGEEWSSSSGEVIGVLVIVFDHHQPQLASRVMHIEHDFGDTIISTQHIHLDHDNCLEIVAVKGDARRVRKLACTLRACKGIRHVTLSMTTTGKGIT